MWNESSTTIPKTEDRVPFQYSFAYFPSTKFHYILSLPHESALYIAPTPVIILQISFPQYLPSYEIPQQQIKKVRNATVTRQYKFDKETEVQRS